MEKCFVIGLTGGSGSGKSEVAKILSGLGAIHINADKVAREVSDEPATLSALREAFGDVVLDENGKYARKRLAQIAFNDREFLEKLSHITHRFIVERITEQIETIKRTTTGRLVVLDAPIPVERGFRDVSDEIWVVTADRDIRIQRIIDRDGISKQEAESRINSQMSDEEYQSLADRLIVNNGDWDMLKQNILEGFYEIVYKK